MDGDGMEWDFQRGCGGGGLVLRCWEHTGMVGLMVWGAVGWQEVLGLVRKGILSLVGVLLSPGGGFDS